MVEIPKQKFVMKRFIRLFGLLMIMAIIGITPAWAQEEGDDILDISLEDLMNITVTSASKKEEKEFDAPSIITTISSKEIEDFGGSNLYEILERSPGFYGLSSYIFRKNSIGLRGDLPGHINPRILFLINGRPFRESVLGGQNVGILTSFPVNSIKQIEIIRGPGSVLYGSNAYVGVVNIITKESIEPELQVQGGIGSFGSNMVQLNGGTSLGELKINGGVNFLKSDGWHFADSTVVRGPNRLFGENDFGEDIFASNLQLNFKGFSLSGYYGSNKMGHITPATSAPGIYESNRTFIDLGYTGEVITDFYSISANVTYNRINDEFDNGFFNGGTSIQKPQSSDYVLEITNFLTLNEKLEMIIGGSVYKLSGEYATGDDAVFAVPSYDKQWLHGYLQADYQATDWLKLVAGGQLNKVGDLKTNFVPRLAAIASFSSGVGAKVMYGQAFRAPYAAETKIFSPPSIQGNPDLVPENISTFEAQFYYGAEKLRTSITYFNSNQTDLITRIPNPDPSTGASLVYTNLGELQSQGFEIEGKYSLNDVFYLDGSYSFQTSEDNNGNKNISRIPQHMFKLGGSVNLKNYANLGIFNAFYSNPIDSETASDGLSQLNSFNWLTARLNVKLDKILNLDHPSVGLIVEGVNLLDQKVYNPEIVFRSFNAVQNKQGLGINVSAYVKF